jgi:hypothetical protein
MLPKKDATNSNTKNQGGLNLLNSVDAVELTEDQMEAISGGNGAIFLLIIKGNGASVGELDRIKSEPIT